MEFNQVVLGQTSFALHLHNELSREDGNLFFSPFSISTTLAMALVGAKEVTREQMLHVLGLKDLSQSEINSGFRNILHHMKSSEVVLETANKLFTEASYNLQQNFVSQCKEFYETEIQALDFKGDPEASRQTINAWAQKETKDKIKDLLPSGSINSFVRLVLANAVYFKGDWAHKFKAEDSIHMNFHIQEGITKRVQMMNQVETFNFVKDKSFKMAEFPYKGGQVSMLVILPENQFGLNECLNALTAQKLNKVISKMRETKLAVSIPKIKLEKQLNLVENLKKMGMVDIFEEGKANLQGISGGNDLFVSQVAHKAYIEVNETGSEAAAATALVMCLNSIAFPSEPPTPFTCDRPFLFLIKNNETNSILFLGRCSDPS